MSVRLIRRVELLERDLPRHAGRVARDPEAARGLLLLTLALWHRGAWRPKMVCGCASADHACCPSYEEALGALAGYRDSDAYRHALAFRPWEVDERLEAAVGKMLEPYGGELTMAVAVELWAPVPAKLRQMMRIESLDEFRGELA